MKNLRFLLVLSLLSITSCKTIEVYMESILIGNNYFTPGSEKKQPDTNNSTTVAKPIESILNERADQDFNNWDIAALDTARDVDYLSSIEKDVILETNMVRSDPKKYAELYIKPRLKYYRDKMYQLPGSINILTSEGVSAVNECIKVLSESDVAPILTPEKGLYLGARDHTKDQSTTGLTGHYGSDRSDPFIRINRYGGNFSTAGENIAYGLTTGREIIIGLLVDDGVPNRGHRTNILSTSFTQTGVSFDKHLKIRHMCAIVYANGYVSK